MSVSNRFVRSAFAFLLLVLALAPIGQVRAQDEPIVGIDGNTYASPTFGYTLAWDEAIWSALEEYTETGYDYLALESDGATLYIEGVYFYQGDSAECLAGERIGIAEESGLDDLTPLVDESDTPFEEFGDGWAYGLYGLPSEADVEQLDSAVYLECRTVVPGSVVMIITGFLNPTDIGGQEEAVLAVIDSIEMSKIEAPAIDSSDLEQVIRLTGIDIDTFWDGVFEDQGESYVVPTYITFGEVIETDCGDAEAGDSGPFYCPSDQTVYLDGDIINGEILPFGVVVVQMVLAHEIGHHVQELLGLTGCFEIVCGDLGSSIAIELQADCLAGAWTQDAAARGYMDERDLKRIEVGIKNYLGDPPDTSREDPDAHGFGEERFGMYLAGYEEGAFACSVEQVA